MATCRRKQWSLRPVAGADLAASAGIRLPIDTVALQMILSTVAPANTLQPVIGAVGRTLSLKQLTGGEFLLGGGWLGDPTPNRRSYTLRPGNEKGNWATAYELLPAVGRQQIARTWCGLEAQSLGHTIHRPGARFKRDYPGARVSGHGFANATAVGRAVADQLAGYYTPELDRLSPNR